MNLNQILFVYFEIPMSFFIVFPPKKLPLPILAVSFSD